MNLFLGTVFSRLTEESTFTFSNNGAKILRKIKLVLNLIETIAMLVILSGIAFVTNVIWFIFSNLPFSTSFSIFLYLMIIPFSLVAIALVIRCFSKITIKKVSVQTDNLSESDKYKLILFLSRSPLKELGAFNQIRNRLE